MDTLDNSSFPLNVEISCTALIEKVLFTTWVIVYTLCSPFFLLVLYIAFRKWQKRHFGNFSHSDAFTFNLIAMEMVAIVGSFMAMVCILTGVTDAVYDVGIHLMLVNGLGKIVFHTFTCVDRYLAVIHPVVYLNLKKQSNVTHRNIAVAVVWVLCIGHAVALYLFNEYMKVTGFLYTIVSIVVISYCTVTVLCALVRPNPGDIGKVKCKPDQLKRNAFRTIILVLATLLTSFMVGIVSFLVVLIEDGYSCLLGIITLWFGFPSSLVLPLLFLHRARAFKAWCRTSQ